MVIINFNVNNKQKEKVLKFDYNALCMVESISNISIDNMLSNPSLTNLRYLLWGGLLHANKSLTLEMVGFWIGETAKNAEKADEIYRNFLTSINTSLQESGLFKKAKSIEEEENEFIQDQENQDQDVLNESYNFNDMEKKN